MSNRHRGEPPGAGASAARRAQQERAGERLRQHGRARVVLPAAGVAAVFVGWAAGSAGGWQVGVVAAAVVVAAVLIRLYRSGPSSWATGAAGERRTAALLRPLARQGWAILHDRAVPNSRANLDHIALSPQAGAVYIDTKNWISGRSRVSVRAGVLYYGRYPQDRALAAVRWEAEQAARALGIPVVPVVAVHGATVPGRQLHLDGVTVVNGKRLRQLLRKLPPAPGWDATRVRATAELAELRLPPHTG